MLMVFLVALSAAFETTKIFNQQPGMKYRPLRRTGIYLSEISFSGHARWLQRQPGRHTVLSVLAARAVKDATAAGLSSGMYTVVMPALNQPNLEAMDA